MDISGFVAPNSASKMIVEHKKNLQSSVQRLVTVSPEKTLDIIDMPVDF